MSSGNWSCNVCTFSNASADVKCAMCDARNPNAPAPSSSSPQLSPQLSRSNTPPLVASNNDNDDNGQQWACPACTFLNPASARACGVCAQPNPAPPAGGDDSESCDSVDDVGGGGGGGGGHLWGGSVLRHGGTEVYLNPGDAGAVEDLAKAQGWNYEMSHGVHTSSVGGPVSMIFVDSSSASFAALTQELSNIGVNPLMTTACGPIREE